MQRDEAQMAELVDALGSGPSGGNTVEVRVLFWAPQFRKPCSSSRAFSFLRPEREVPADFPRGLERIAPASAIPGSRMGDRVLFWAPQFRKPCSSSRAFSFLRPEREVPADFPRGLERIAPAGAIPGSRTGDRVLFWAPIRKPCSSSRAFSFPGLERIAPASAILGSRGSRPHARPTRPTSVSLVRSLVHLACVGSHIRG